MKKIFQFILEIAATSTMLALLLFFILKIFYTYIATSLDEKQTYDVTFLDSLVIALLYTLTMVILFSSFTIILKKVIDVLKFKYLFGLLIGAGFIILLKATTGTLDFSDNLTKIEIVIVTLFGLIIPKMMWKYLL